MPDLSDIKIIQDPSGGYAVTGVAGLLPEAGEGVLRIVFDTRENAWNFVYQTYYVKMGNPW